MNNNITSVQNVNNNKSFLSESEEENIVKQHIQLYCAQAIYVSFKNKRVLIRNKIGVILIFVETYITPKLFSSLMLAKD
jgi:hypothetical protein